MKKIISLLLLTAVVGMAAAQNIAYQQGEKTNKKAYQSSMIKLLPGNKQGEIVSVEPELKAVTTMGDPNHSIKSVLVRLVDAEWNETQSVKIANTAEWGISDAFRTESKIHLLLDNVEKQNYTIRHVALDAATLQVSVDEHLMKTTLEKGSEGYFLTATSPDGQYHGVVFSALGKKNVVIETRMILFDKEMNKVWEQKVDNNIAHKMLVSNQGDIVIYSMSFTDKSKDETVVRFNAANAQGVKYGEFVTADDIDQLALLQYKGGNLVATALEGQGGRSLIQFSLPGHVAGRHYLAVHSYLFDMNVGRLTADNRHEFTDDEACVFFNTKVPPIVKPDFLTQVDHRRWRLCALPPHMESGDAQHQDGHDRQRNGLQPWFVAGACRQCRQSVVDTWYNAKQPKCQLAQCRSRPLRVQRQPLCGDQRGQGCSRGVFRQGTGTEQRQADSGQHGTGYLQVHPPRHGVETDARPRWQTPAV